MPPREQNGPCYATAVAHEPNAVFGSHLASCRILRCLRAHLIAAGLMPVASTWLSARKSYARLPVIGRDCCPLYTTHRLVVSSYTPT